MTDDNAEHSEHSSVEESEDAAHKKYGDDSKVHIQGF